MLVLTQWANILEIREVALGSQTLTELSLIYVTVTNRLEMIPI